MVYVNKQGNENATNLVRRFSRLMRESGILMEVRSKKYYQPKKTRRLRRESAAWREKVRRIRKDLLKKGEIQRREKIDPERLRRELER